MADQITYEVLGFRAGKHETVMAMANLLLPGLQLTHSLE